MLDVNERRERGLSHTSATDPLTTTSAIPEGGGTVFRTHGVVITQPTRGVFLAFSATCTHQGCTVRAVAGGTINCLCHGSRFRIADGSVAGGPATQPLPPLPILVIDGMISLG
jgi:Rieske Fe-S protein